MIHPDLKEFSALARKHTLVPVVKSISADLLTPVSAFHAVAKKEPYSFLLESVEGGEKIGRYTFLGFRPYMRMQSRAGEVEIIRGRQRKKFRGNPFETLRDLLREHTPAQIAGAPPFTAGAVGFFSYDAVRQLEKIPDQARNDTNFPDAAFMFYDRLLAFDHVRQQIHIIAAADMRNENPRRAYERALADIARIEKQLARGVTSGQIKVALKNSGKRVPKIRATTSAADYKKSVKRAKEYIAAG